MNIEIDPITGAPIIRPKDVPTANNPIMPVVAEPTSSPGLTAPVTVIPAPKPFIATVSETPEKEAMRVEVDAEVEDNNANHISSLYPAIKQILREGGGDTQQQGHTFAKLKELLDTYSFEA